MKNLTEIIADAFDSGEMTTAMPSFSKAGSWKQSDLPPPVGRMVRAGEHFLRDVGGLGH